MLITFTSKVYPDVVMFGDVATVLLHAMDLHALGLSEQPPGVLRGENIRLASDKLRDYLGTVPREKPFADDAGNRNPAEDERKESRSRVGLRTRAQPLLEMMDVSYRKHADVIFR
jgi:hypothetical protein